MQDSLTQFSQELFSRLDALAAQLGVASNAVWETLLRQAPIEAEVVGWRVVVLWILIVVVGLAFVLFAGLVISGIFVNSFDWEDGVVEAALIFVCALGAFFLSGALLDNKRTQWTLERNPQYWALEQLRDVVR